MIISVLQRRAGFFSEFFFTVNHLIHCICTNQSFRIDTRTWMFKYKEGWTDYFEPIEYTVKDDTDESRAKVHIHSEALGSYNMYWYMDIMKNYLYRYNAITKTAIQQKKEELGLTIAGTYDSIFIRRGDKLMWESDYYYTHQYVDLLLQKNPLCKTIFLQTDDYNAFTDLQEYVKEKNLEIRVITMCHPHIKGMITTLEKIEYNGNTRSLETKIQPIECRKYDSKTQDYFAKIKEDLLKFKQVADMTPDEVYQHTLEMIVGLDIVLHSKFCILENQSNVSRFISIMHDHRERVFDIRFPLDNFNMLQTLCPGHM